MDIQDKILAIRGAAATRRFSIEGNISRSQRTSLMICFKSITTNRDERLKIATSLVGRDIKSFDDLSYGEAKTLINEFSDSCFNEILLYLKEQ